MQFQQFYWSKISQARPSPTEPDRARPNSTVGLWTDYGQAWLGSLLGGGYDTSNVMDLYQFKTL